MVTPQDNLSSRDADLLRAVADHAGPDGWARPRARAVLFEAAKLSRQAWQRGSRSLVNRGLLVADPVEREGFSEQPTAYQVTTKGADALSLRGSVTAARATSGPRPSHETEPRTEPPLRESPSLGSKKTSEESLASSSGGAASHHRATATEPRATTRPSHDDAARWPHGYLTVPLSADPEENAALMAALADFYWSRKTMKFPFSPAPAGASQASVESIQRVEPPKPAPTRPPVDETACRVGWTRIEEAWQYELQIPKGHLVGAQNVWIGLHAVPGEAPTGDEVLAALRIMAPQWKAKAKEEGSWQFVPLLKTWLRDRAWKLAAPPAPVPGDSAAPLLGPVEKGAIDELKKKGTSAKSRGDYALANDYQTQIDRIRKTGRVA